MPQKLTVCIRTYGCQMNERDSDAAAFLLRQAGMAIADDEESADVIVINTCSVRGKAEDKAIGKAGLLIAGKRRHPGRIVGLIGCMVERRKEELWRVLPGLDFAVGTHRLAELPAIIAGAAADRGPALAAGAGHDDIEQLAGHDATGIAAFVNILLGCNRRCAYCVVPTVRGRELSRQAAAVIGEIRGLVARGVKEVTLLGQSVMSYGRANPVWPADHRSPRGFRQPFPMLLEALQDGVGAKRIRFTSGHPSGCCVELARAMAELPVVCEHLHLPLQSGSDRILRRMRRGYTLAGYRQAVSRMRAAVPGIAITTDIIVGFPGETDGDFQQTREFMDEIGFDGAFIFKYSPRPGTPAASWNDDIPAGEKMLRNKLLLADQERRAMRINQALNGQTVEVLAEGPSKRNAERWSGRTRTNKIVVFHNPGRIAAGDLVRVVIRQIHAQSMVGEVVSWALGVTAEQAPPGRTTNGFS